MNMPLTIMQATHWNKYSFEEWCRQLGAWLNGNNETIVRIVKVMPTKGITPTYSQVASQNIEQWQRLLMNTELMQGESD